VPIRSQLSLFVPTDVGGRIEAVRRMVDPEQRRLIPAHVTLCREDEVAALRLEDIASRLGECPRGHVTLQFGAPERCLEHGILLPCLGGTPAFNALRECILGPLFVRPLTPHMTLAHPRNPKVPGNELTSAASLRDGLTVTFTDIQFIEQADNAPWVVRRTFPLAGTSV
jgi:2'-5' RNA ligase